MFVYLFVYLYLCLFTCYYVCLVVPMLKYSNWLLMHSLLYLNLGTYLLMF